MYINIIYIERERERERELDDRNGKQGSAVTFGWGRIVQLQNFERSWKRKLMGLRFPLNRVCNACHPDYMTNHLRYYDSNPSFEKHTKRGRYRKP